MRSRRALCVIAVAGMWNLFGQSVQKRPSFEVASVKAMLVGDPVSDAVPQRSGDRVRMHNATLFSVIAWAYHLTNPDYQIVEGPWTRALYDDYDIQALAPGAPDDDALRLMFQTLLADRFKLQVHRETRELASYDLVVAKGGSKLVPARPGPKHSMAFGGISSWVEIRSDGLLLTGMGASMEELAIVLTRKMNAPVLDRTSLTGTFNYSVKFSSGVDESDAPVLTTAIHELGLTLEKSKGSFEVTVIDHLEKPSQN